MTALQAKLQAAHDAQAIAALRRDVAAYRLALAAAVEQLHLSHLAVTKLRETNLRLREENRIRMGLPVDIEGAFL